MAESPFSGSTWSQRRCDPPGDRDQTVRKSGCSYLDFGPLPFAGAPPSPFSLRGCLAVSGLLSFRGLVNSSSEMSQPVYEVHSHWLDLWRNAWIMSPPRSLVEQETTGEHHPGGDVQLPVDASQVEVHGVAGEEQTTPDLSVGKPFGYESCDTQLCWCETGETEDRTSHREPPYRLLGEHQ